MITPVIMAGGSGSRLWPLSRSLYPKQFLALTSQNTMLQETISRLEGVATNAPMVICNEEHRFVVAEQLRAIDKSASIILEPVGRNTAPAVAIAAEAAKGDDDPLLFVLAADHVIQDASVFREALNNAIPLAQEGKLVTFGIVPDKAHTGYGYIQRGDSMADGNGYVVEQFVEKPDASTAAGYVNSGEFYWNSGMFLFKASRYLEELTRCRSDIAQVCRQAMANTTKDQDFIRLDAEVFAQCPDESIDYAVMEHTKDAVVVPLDAGWNDIGSWSSLWEVNAKDEDGNVILGDTMLHDTSNCLVHGGERLIATVGLNDVVVIDTKDALLVADKARVQDVKKIVEQLKADKRGEYENHREVYRPWGKYDSIGTGARDQVKRITVKPGGKLSIQKHYHRAEHWIVVSGTASVLRGEETQLVTENQSIYIPLGTVHALENPGKIPLEMIEVQTGSYLGEDDIVRFEDKYGRV
ncbi:mannose-1-phosphate guanylyltransferase/mannose-6-phosphate isomerase [Agarivorans sp. Alg241-V36]|uniref:mannose-1-phosphate guanylyltransferase/mannose-6-phosphate isomerase n=1 Tax=Agarivorans sp. Alg241-V36 TaxID=2305992 RepID=UPI0013D6764F|nr:mannose-1-phosphate guanylyltransferase/mannose-6-phosphate isomerase [Agarivorans sp. Alg241-V36]